jgi:hypothetical protein
MSKAQIVRTTVADGRYYWKLLFNYDNTGNTGEIVDQLVYRKVTKANGKDFMSQKFNIDTGFTYDNQASASIQFEGVGEGSDKVEYNFHIETAYELQKTSETYTEIDETVEQTRKFTIGPNGKLKLYQLCYATDGVDLETTTVATEPQPDAIVKLKFAYVNRILGLEDILKQFAETFPERSNTEEWRSLRDRIVQSSALSGLTEFHSFVEALSEFVPKSSNVREWAAIRETCNEIEGAWPVENNKQLLFKKLLLRFSVTRPESENTREWAAIRNLSDKILAGMKEVNWGKK